MVWVGVTHDMGCGVEQHKNCRQVKACNPHGWPCGVGPYSLVVLSNPEQDGSGFGGSCLGLNLRHP